MGLQNWLKLKLSQREEFKCNGVEKHLQSSAEYGSQVDGKTLGPEGEGQNLDRVGDRERRESNVVESEEDEEKGHCSASSSFNGMLSEGGTESCDDDEGYEHARGGDEPKRTAAKTLCADSTTECKNSIPDLEGKVDTGLSDGARDANALEDRRQVV